MDDLILNELKDLRQLLSKLIGTTDLPDDQKFSKNALDKAAKEFQKLSIERGEWVETYDIHKIIKGAPYNNAGKFIIDNFGFKNYFIRGRTHYFNKTDLKALNNELKERNIHLGRYMELLADQEKLRNYIKRVPIEKKLFNLPKGLKDIQKTPPALPPIETIKNYLTCLKKEFKNDKLTEFIDLYQNKTYAMFKHEYYFDRYMDPIKMKQCKKWCENFNHANEALKKIKLELKKSE